MNIGNHLASTLHQRVTKPSGFRKTGNTFSKDHADYSEHYNIQGSAWNDPARPWTFYVNCAISFPGVPNHSAGTGLWKFHAHTRIAGLVPGASSQYAVTEASLEEVVDEVARHIHTCSGYFSRRWEVLRESYIKRDYAGGFPRDPERNNTPPAAPSNGDKPSN